LRWTGLLIAVIKEILSKTDLKIFKYCLVKHARPTQLFVVFLKRKNENSTNHFNNFIIGRGHHRFFAK
jgi:hypothetical protein